MNSESDWEAIALEEIRFFGAVSAAISHEINNRFAVINEKAGLLMDLSSMMAQGREVDPARIETQSAKIGDQVRQAKEIVRNLNRFAHSVDATVAEIDLPELLHFMAALSARRAAAVEASLTVADSREPLAVTTIPFILQALVGRGIDIALTKVGADRAVILAAVKTDSAVEIRFEGLQGVAEPIDFSEAGKNVPALLVPIGARYVVAPDGSALVLQLPEKGVSYGRTR
jgi:C4-dicarboxylate-specific signal transduction histidine kinase